MVIMLSLLMACGDKEERAQTTVTNIEENTEEQEETQEEAQEEECINDEDFFAQEVWAKALSPVCYSCHNAQGAAASSDLVLASNSSPNYLVNNRERLSYVASLEIEGESLILRKPLGLDGHGGGSILTEDSEAFLALKGFVARLDNPVLECEGDAETSDEDTKLIMASPVSSLRKITLNLLGTLPSEDHQIRVKNGGEEALREIVGEILTGTELGYKQNTEELVGERLIQLWNDKFLTDKYMSGGSAIQASDYDRYPNIYYYQQAAENMYDIRDKINDSIAREPLELMRYVFLQDKPWSEILTADYTMVNDWSAYAYGLGGAYPTYGNETHDIYRAAYLTQVPTVGILSTAAFMNRYPTTDTNRNRHRSKVVFDYFLNTDILALGDRPIDADNSAIHNPTLNDPQCNICHSVMEPVAGAFQNWDDDGHYNPPEDGWYPEMFQPGFEGETIAVTEADQALRWLAEKIVVDRRFARATVNQVFTGITGFPILREYELDSSSASYQAWELQDAFLDQLTTQFEESELNLKIVIQEIVLSSYFRAVDHSEASEGELMFAGTARFLTPEELDKKILAITGVQWSNRLRSRYRLLYGGIDSDGVTKRLTEPNGVMGAVTLRMANEIGCYATGVDFSIPKTQRRLFPYIETTYQPYTEDGFDVPQVQENIRLNIQHLFSRVLGQELALDDPEIETAYQLWLDLHRTGKEMIEDGTETASTSWYCRARENPETGEDLPDVYSISRDEDYTMRAWRGVLTYLLADYHFVME